jgi:hypothetical protein
MELLIYVALFSQITKRMFTKNDRLRFNKFFQLCHISAERALNFIGLALETVHITTFVDASFAQNADGSSQLDVLVCLRGSTGKCNVLHAISAKSRRVARSSLDAEYFAMLEGFDVSYTS